MRWDADPSVFAYTPGGAVASRLSWWATGGANEQAEATYAMVEADEAERPVTEHGPGVVATMTCVGQVCEPAWQPVVSHTRYGLDGYRLWHTTTATEGAGRRVVRDGGATVGVFSASGALVEWVLPGGLGLLEGPTLALRYALRDHLGTARGTVDGVAHFADGRGAFLAVEALTVERRWSITLRGGPKHDAVCSPFCRIDIGRVQILERAIGRHRGRLPRDDGTAGHMAGADDVLYVGSERGGYAFDCNG